jgi:hypothetical protein
MEKYRALQTSGLTANPEQATRQCGSCGKLYAVPENVWNHRCLCGSRTLYLTASARVSAIAWTSDLEAASRYGPEKAVVAAPSREERQGQ